MDRRIVACFFGLFLQSFSCFSRCCFFAVFMSVFNLFLCFLCFVIFSCVGFSMRLWCSLCCFFICLFIFGLHHAFLGRFGIASCCSITCCIVCWMLWKCWFVVVSSLLVVIVFVISVLILLIILSFIRSYRPCDSVLHFLLVCCRGGGL